MPRLNDAGISLSSGRLVRSLKGLGMNRPSKQDRSVHMINGAGEEKAERKKGRRNGLVGLEWPVREMPLHFGMNSSTNPCPLVAL